MHDFHWHLLEVEFLKALNSDYKYNRGRRGRDRMVVGFTTTYAISAYHHLCLWVRILFRTRCRTLCDKVCQSLATGRWFSPGPRVSFTNKTDCHDITKILFKVALNTIKQTKQTNIIPQIWVRVPISALDIKFSFWNFTRQLDIPVLDPLSRSGSHDMADHLITIKNDKHLGVP